jgi:hypothetical protein
MFAGKPDPKRSRKRFRDDREWTRWSGKLIEKLVVSTRLSGRKGDHAWADVRREMPLEGGEKPSRTIHPRKK